MERPRILHLVDPGTPGGGACTLRLLGETIARLPALEHDVIVIGSRGHGDLARRCGVVIDGVVCPPLGRPLLARRALARAVARREAERGRYDRVHAWTMPAAALAAVALPGRRRIATPTVGPLRPAAGWPATLVRNRHRPTPVFAASRGVVLACADQGVCAYETRELPPAVNGSRDDGQPRATLRERWGVAPDAWVVAFVAEPSAWADAIFAVGVVARMAAALRPVCVVVHHGAARRVAAERWVRRAGHRERMIVEDAIAEPWRVMPGVDAVYAVTGPDARRPERPEPGLLPMLLAMHAGVPVIAEATESVRAAVGDEESALVVTPRDVNGACRALARLYDDREQTRRIGEAGARRVREAFGFDAYGAGLLRAYTLSAGPSGVACALTGHLSTL